MAFHAYRFSKADALMPNCCTMSTFRKLLRRMHGPAAAADTVAPQCPHCSSTRIKRTLKTHPVPLTGRLAGRRVDVYRVPMLQCRDCGALTPTAEGLAKIERCTKTGIEFFMEHLPAEPQRVPPAKQKRSRVRKARKPPA